MYFKMLGYEFSKNPWKNLILFLLIGLSATMAVTVVLTLTRLFSSVSSMYETANPPHFLQMHRGSFSQEEVDAFNREYDGVIHWQTVAMINVYGDALTVSDEKGKRFSLSDCRLETGFVRQNDEYDVLLDENRDRLTVKKGEIGVPVILLDEFSIEIGDVITLSGKGVSREFVVTAYVYDGQMNSTLCSSTRFLISDEDFDAMLGSVGETEYLIEAWFLDSAQAADYQTAYEKSGRNLPKNGQAITYTMIFLLSALTDLMTAAVFFLVGFLLLLMVLVCLRYTVLTELEEDMREIGTMKAMGIPEKGIRNLYLGKIRILAAAGCAAGIAPAFFLTSLLGGHIRRTFGSPPHGFMGLYMAVPAAAAVYGMILVFSGKVLRRLGKVTVTELLVTGRGNGRGKRVWDGLRKSNRLPVSLLIGLHEVRRGYGMVFGLLLTVSALIAIPLRTVQTMEDRAFVTYMGSPVYELLVEVEQGDALEERNRFAEQLLKEQMAAGKIERMDALRRVRLQAVKDDGKMIGVHVDAGVSAGAGLSYLDGKNPGTDAEIALSCLMADELEKEVGDTVDILVSGERREFTVCGIYQDVTSGGRTAKTCCPFPKEQAEKYSYGLALPREEAKGLASRLSGQLGKGYRVEDMEEFLRQILGGVVAQVRQASAAALLIGISLTVLITTLFLKLRMARENSSFAAKKAMGIPIAAICLQELFPVLIAGGGGAVCGMFLAETFGDCLIGGLFGMLGMGVKKMVFAGVPVRQFAEILAVLLVTVSVATLFVCGEIKGMNIAGDGCE